ncbi:MAG: helix-turn-helix transcriptional regulator [Sphingomonadales bacterium]|nr:helix-turn-helix transcriptional regulator [Sphingomonadales bacterium]
MADDEAPPPGPNPLLALTDKQREVLDLLLEHKTSKEISRLLGISPHTVDQRLMQARAKLGVASRGEVANVYRQLKAVWENSAYQFSYMAENAYLLDSLHGTERMGPETDQPPAVDSGGNPVLDFRVGSELFEGRWGTLARLGAIVALALFLVLLVLGGVSMFVSLSRLMGR